MNDTSSCTNVICIKWGTAYSHEDVNRLYAMVRRNAPAHTIKGVSKITIE